MKLAQICAAALLWLLAASGCSSDARDPSAEATPTPTATSSEVPGASETPTPTTPAWHNKFTPEQLETYEAALQRWQEYTDKTNEIYAKGKDTPEARAVFREYSMRWQADVASLASTAARRVRIIQPQEPLSWRALSIKPGIVIVSQCTDYSQVEVREGGRKLDGATPDNPITPLVIEMDKPPGRDWMVASIELKDKRACAA